MELAMKRGIPLQKLVTHKFSIDEAEAVLQRSDYMKGVIVP
jgi:hypothetical protein